MNKKGFTILEMFFAIVILSLTITIASYTIFPALENSKKKSIIIYANRILEQAKQNCMISNKKEIDCGSLFKPLNQTFFKVKDAPNKYSVAIYVNYSNDNYLTNGCIISYDKKYAVRISENKVLDVLEKDKDKEYGNVCNFNNDEKYVILNPK